MKNLLPPLLFLLTLPMFGQSPPKRFVLGGVIGFEAQLLGIQTLDGLEPEQTAVLSDRLGNGISIGGFGRWQLLPMLAIRQGLALNRVQNTVLFRPHGTVRYEFIDVELPLHFVVTNRTHEPFPLRASFLFGGRVSANFASPATHHLLLLRERFAIDIGLGVEIGKNKWRFQPEFVYSHGMNNMHDFSNSDYDWLVGRVVRDRMTLRVLVWRE